MRRLSFFQAATILDLHAAAAVAGARLGPEVAPSWLVRAVAPLHRAGRDEISVFFEGFDPAELAGTRAGACLVTPAYADRLPSTTIALLTDTPRDGFLRLAAVLHPASLRSSAMGGSKGIDPAAHIAETTDFEPGVSVDAGAVVGDDVEIGSGSFLGANCVVGAGVRIGRDCAIGAGAVLCHALIGDRVVIQSGARLGQIDGDPASAGGEPSLGRVIVQNDVTIGANAVVARGRLSDTVIGEGARLAALASVSAGTVVERCGVVGRLQR